MKICVVKAGLQGRVCPILTFLRVVEEPEAITKPSAHASGGLPLLSELKGDCVHETTRNEGNLEWQSCIRKDLCRAYAQAPYIYIYNCGNISPTNEQVEALPQARSRSPSRRKKQLARSRWVTRWICVLDQPDLQSPQILRWPGHIHTCGHVGLEA